MKVLIILAFLTGYGDVELLRWDYTSMAECNAEREQVYEYFHSVSPTTQDEFHQPQRYRCVEMNEAEIPAYRLQPSNMYGIWQQDKDNTGMPMTDYEHKLERDREAGKE